MISNFNRFYYFASLSDVNRITIVAVNNCVKISDVNKPVTNVVLAPSAEYQIIVLFANAQRYNYSSFPNSPKSEPFSELKFKINITKNAWIGCVFRKIIIFLKRSASGCIVLQIRLIHQECVEVAQAIQIHYFNISIYSRTILATHW